MKIEAMVAFLLASLQGQERAPLKETESYGCGGQNRFGIPFWLAGEFTTHFRTDFSGWIESDVHWGLTDLDFDPWPYTGNRVNASQNA